MKEEKEIKKLINGKVINNLDVDKNDGIELYSDSNLNYIEFGINVYQLSGVEDGIYQFSSLGDGIYKFIDNELNYIYVSDGKIADYNIRNYTDVLLSNKIIENLVNNLQSKMNYDLSDIGNEIGYTISLLHCDKYDGFSKEDFLNGFNHGYSLNDGTH